MTTREFYNTVINSTLDDDTIEFARKALEKLNSKSDTKRKSKAEEDEPLREAITKVLADAENPMLTSEIATACGLSTPKASALLRKMSADGELTETEVKIAKVGKRKAYHLA